MGHRETRIIVVEIPFNLWGGKSGVKEDTVVNTLHRVCLYAGLVEME